MDRNTRIAIVGAGPAGLATAYYLKKNGYKKVTVLEVLGRVGGLCRSITVDHVSFDLGANYITAAYKETRKIAEEIGAETYAAKPYCIADVPFDGTPATYKSMLQDLRRDPDDPNKTTPTLTLLAAGWKFLKLRWRLRGLIDKPQFTGVADYDGAQTSEEKKLCVPFEDWLRANGIVCLKPFFEIPITMMGFGFLDETATPYVLRFMTLRTVLPMVLQRIPVLKYFFERWPKRFVYGFQRFWEDVARDLNVRLGVEIESIYRPFEAPGLDRIAINFKHRGQVFYDEDTTLKTLYFDHLILACPLHPDNLNFLRLSRFEQDLFDQVETVSYCMSTFEVENLEMMTEVACVPPFTRAAMGRPWAVLQLFPKESKLVQFVTRINAGPNDDVEGAVLWSVKQMLHQMGAYVAGEDPAGPDPQQECWSTYDRWAYFQHVSPKSFGEGFYDRLERLQGTIDNTYYVGGPTNFELIEPILEYSKSLVEHKFGRAS